MFTRLVAYGLVIAGVLCFVWPGRLKRKLARTSRRKLRALFFLVATAAGGLLVSVTWHHEGWLPKGITVLGIVLILKGLFLLKGAAADRLAAWLNVVPTTAWRVAALLEIGLGLLILRQFSG